MRWIVFSLFSLAVTLFWGACSQSHPQTAGESPFIRGTARVITVDAVVGQALLDFQGRQVYGYWLTSRQLAQPGTVEQADPLKPPVGQYQEAVEKPEIFAAVPGDTIEFVGMRTGNDIFLRNISIIRHTSQ